MSDEEDLEEIPRVLLATIADVAKWMPEPMVKAYGKRPVWFLLGMDAELVELFERIPEDPMQKGHQQAILQGLRAFVGDHNEDLQALLGTTDEISVGFHVDANLTRVTESFEEDGFLIVGSIKEGEIVVSEETGEGEIPPSS